MFGEWVRESVGRATVTARLARVVPEMIDRETRSGADGPRLIMGGMEYELDEDGEWVAVED